jgi:hypothetical protein
MKSGPSTALVRTEHQLDVYAQDPSWQRLWLNLESESWRSLAIVPAGGLSSIELVHGLAAVAWHQRSSTVIVADLRTIGLSALATARGELRRRVDGGERVLIAMQSIDKSAITATIAREADKVLLCVHLGHTSRSQVKDAIRELGTQRSLGSILIRTSS